MIIFLVRPRAVAKQNTFMRGKENIYRQYSSRASVASQWQNIHVSGVSPVFFQFRGSIRFAQHLPSYLRDEGKTRCRQLSTQPAASEGQFGPQGRSTFKSPTTLKISPSLSTYAERVYFIYQETAGTRRRDYNRRGLPRPVQESVAAFYVGVA